MRGARALSLASLVGVAVLASVSIAENASRGCAGRVGCARLRLPAPITILPGGALRSGGFRIGRDGRVRRVRVPASPYPRDAAFFPGTGTWYLLEHRHLVVGRGRKPLWRSHGEIVSRSQLGVIAASARAVAFQHDHRLYVAAVGGAERPVAHRELPLGWTAGGLYTYAYEGRRLLLRSDAGAFVKVIGRRPLGSDYQVANGYLYFVSGGALMSAHGGRVARLASLSRLGVSANPWLQSLGRMVELQDNHRLVVVDPGGTVFASTGLPLSRGQPQSPSSTPVVSPDARTVAFTAASGQSTDPDARRRSSGEETVYLLRKGARAAVAMHRERVAFAPCERGASLEWHGHWLLYSATEGNLAAIDATGVHAAVALRSLVETLPGTHDRFTADWSEQPRVAG